MITVLRRCLWINVESFSWKYGVWTSSNRYYVCLCCTCEYNKYILLLITNLSTWYCHFVRWLVNLSRYLHFEVFVDWCMFTCVFKKLISSIGVVIHILWVETVEYMCASSSWYTGFSVCMSCCIKTYGYWSFTGHVCVEGDGDYVVNM